MHPHLFPTITLFLIIVTITLIHCPTSLRADNEKYVTCEAPFNCGNLVNLNYPFWASNRPNYCGHPSFQLNCSSNVPQINITTINYRVLEIINPSRTLKVARTDFLDPICPAAFVNTTIDNNLFSYITSGYTNLTLYYNCRTPLAAFQNLAFYQFNCSVNSSTNFINYYTLSPQTFLAISDLIGACNYWVNVPVLQSAVPTTATYGAVLTAIASGFMLGWDANNSQCDTCLKAGGLCGSDPTTSTFACHCTNGTFASGCSTASTKNNKFSKIEMGEAICAALNCSGFTNLGYPFWGLNRPEYCGHPSFQLDCSNDAPRINISNINYKVLDVNQTLQTLRVARTDYWDTICPSVLVNTTIDFTLFSYTTSDTNLTLYYQCPFPAVPITSVLQFNCTINNTNFFNYYFQNIYSPDLSSISNSIGACNYWVNVTILQPTPVIPTKDAVTAAIDGGFMLTWNARNPQCDTCLGAGGLCGSDPNTSAFACHCQNGTFVSGCAGPVSSSRSSSILEREVVIGITAAVLGTIVVCIIISCLRREQLIKSLIFRRTARKNDENVKAFILNYGSLAPKHYSYAEIKKMTNSFINKLGQGGYSSVYKGKLPDGKLVAVKVLSESKGNGEDFINEVASICRTSHVNIVTLLGFSYEKNKRALIYEFMPNGSLDKFIYHGESSATNCHLEWKTLYKIAVDIARGLEYLHRGCSTRILHFDIKPQNILLDEDFNPKISDFGLAKLCQRKESIVSMIGMRGTAGYIAPEVFSRNFGGVSHKSDVYSYGMLVLEMVGGRKNFDAGVSNSSEKYFPDWIYKDLELGLDGRTCGVIREEKETSSKMILVSLWCIQTNPTDRPSMNKVVEMLEGTLHSLQIPPKPFLCSPKVSPVESSTTSLSQN